MRIQYLIVILTILSFFTGIHSFAYTNPTLFKSFFPDEEDSFKEKEEEKKRWGVTIPLAGTRLYWDNGIHIDGRYEKIKFTIRGKLFVDGGYIGADEALEIAFPDLEGGNIILRHMDVIFHAVLLEALEFKLDLDFANLGQVQDNWFRFTNVRVLKNIRFGHQKEPVSLETLTGNQNRTFMESALPVQALAVGRNIGGRYRNDFLEKKMTLALGGFWATGSFSSIGEASDQISNSYGFDISARVTRLLWYENQGEKVLHLGFSYAHGFRDQNSDEANAQYRSRPESHLTDLRLVDTGELTIGGQNVVGAECAFVSGPTSLQGELLADFIQADTAGDPNFWGFYFYGSHFLTGEHRRYNPSSAIFTSVAPKKPFRPRQGQWGALELAFRFSFLDLNSGLIQGGRERDITAGLNWYLFPRIRMMFNYVRATVKDRKYTPSIDKGTANIFQTRLQFVF